MSFDEKSPEARRLYERDRALTALLSLSKHMAHARSRRELERVLDEQLKALFYFSHCHIYIFSKAKNTYENFVSSPSNSDKTFKGDAFAISPQLTDFNISSIQQNDNPLLFDLPQLEEHKALPESLRLHFEAGIKEMVLVRLNTEIDCLGVVSFYSDRSGSFPQTTIELIHGFASQISITIDNIIAYESIEKKEMEKEILLSFSASIEKVKDRKDLVEVLREKLTRLLAFNDIAISLYNAGRQTFQVFAHQVTIEIERRPDFETVIAPEYPIEDGIHNTALAAEQPVIIKIEDALRSPNRHAGTLFIVESGIKEMLLVKLINGDRVLGFLNILSQKSGAFEHTNYSMLKGITEQLSTAIANILSREEILRRDTENEILLAVSAAISSSRTLDTMVSVIRNRLGRFMYINDICVSYYNLASFDYRVLSYEGDLVCKHPGFGFVPETDFPLDDGIHNVLLHSVEPVCFGFDELKAMRMPHIDFMLLAGVRTCTGIRLVSNNLVIGALILTSGKQQGFSEADCKLIQRISQHLATGVSNIKATEKLNQQFEEINRYEEQLEEQKSYLLEEVKEGFPYNDIIGTSEAMQKVFQLLAQVSFTNSTVLLLGETGTGKELIARAIHNSSGRKDKLMVRVNCAAIPPNLIESELFGHEKGSFTGAFERRIGKFELADQGTLLLDEIGELPIDLQTKLLRAIQEREIERIGGKGAISIDVRIIAATNRSLLDEMQQGRFRSDLYYRLNVFPILLPPLRDRKDDIALLAKQFVARFSKNYGKKISRLSSNAMKALLAYPWPGNVRELEHQMERCVLVSTGNVIRDVQLPVLNPQLAKFSTEGLYTKTHAENERDYIIEILKKCNGKVYGPGGAAQLLHMKVGTLNSKIKKFGIAKEQIILK